MEGAWIPEGPRGAWLWADEKRTPQGWCERGIDVFIPDKHNVDAAGSKAGPGAMGPGRRGPGQVGGHGRRLRQ